MPNLLEQIGSGLRGAGAVFSPDVYEKQARERGQFENLKAQRGELILQLAARAAENGSITPEAFQQIAQKYGVEGAPAVGPSIPAQKLQQDMQREQKLLQFRSGARQKAFGRPLVDTPVTGEGVVNPDGTGILPTVTSDAISTGERQLNYANALIESGEPELVKEGESLLKTLKEKDEKQSPLGLLMQERAQAVQMYGEGHQIVKQYDDAIAKQTTDSSKNVQFKDLATGKTVNGKPEFQDYRVMPDGTLKPEGAPYVKGASTEVNVKVGTEPLPEKAQERLTQAFQMKAALDDVKSVIGKSGIVKGWFSKGAAELGLDADAIKFDTATNNLKVMAQAIIVGIPSNFDVQTFINTLPSLTKAESVNEQRIAYTENAVKGIIRDTLAYYKGTKKIIPAHIVEMAKEIGIDPDNVKAWDGKGDPLSNARSTVIDGLVATYKTRKGAEEAFMRDEIKSADDLAEVFKRMKQ